MQYFYLLPTGKSDNFGAIRMPFDKLLEIIYNHSKVPEKFILFLDDNKDFNKCTRLTAGTLKQIKDYIDNETNRN